MCGIAAIFSYNNGPPVDERELLRIRDRMTSRGPDGAGMWVSEDRSVGLAHRRLAIIDLSPTADQPMTDDSGVFTITFNGEIYNYKELRRELKARGYRFRSTSDTEVLLHLYADRGVKMLDDLRGMYAFALWDRRKKSLFLARDPFGIKPLYYADDGHTFRAASQVKALLAGGAVDTGVDPAGHVGFFLWGHVPEPYTLYKGIRSVPAGSFVWLEAGKSRRVESFLSISNVFTESVHAGKDDAEWNRQQADAYSISIRDSLRNSVRHHMIADVPVGIFLSSGIDSTTIASLAAEEGSSLHTITLGFEEYKGTEDDEVPLAEETARCLGARHETVWITRQDFEEKLEHLFSAMDQPSIDGVNAYWVSLAARRAGLKAALSGLGGDELFGGYPSFHQIPRAVSALRPFQSLPALSEAFRSVIAPVLKRWTSPKYAGLFEYGGTFAGAYLLRRALFMPWELPEILDPDLVREGWRTLAALSAIETITAIPDSPRSKVACMESCWYMRNQLLRDADWAGMAHSVEIRVPLVDLELVRTVARSVGAGCAPDKATLAAAALFGASQALLGRPKTGFKVPVRDWLLTKDHGTTPRGLRGWSQVVYGAFAA